MSSLVSTKESKGFTLVELVVVIGILALLLTIVLIAINPSRQFAQANNARRSSDINAILNAVGAYEAENSGSPPITLTATSTDMKSGGGIADICALLVPKYISAMPIDPKTGSYTSCATYDTGYFISKDVNNRVTITAPNTDIAVSAGGAVLGISR
ncbi:MAG TPA: type II secretion system protein [Patescibacteria group bacterium]|nr:type II secretion system protein [Patescibacteria group bacterium]